MGFFCYIVRSQLHKSQTKNSDILTDLKKNTPKKQAPKSETNIQIRPEMNIFKIYGQLMIIVWRQKHSPLKIISSDVGE